MDRVDEVIPTGDQYHSGLTIKGQRVEKTLHDAWFDNQVTDISLEARNLLEHYSKIPPAEVVPHVLRMRARAFAIANYACIGQMRFLLCNLSRLPFHSRIVARLRAGASFMDAGCCVGQELRYLVADDSIDSAQLFGFDMQPNLIDIGYDLFNDRDHFKGKFVFGDVLMPEDRPEAANLTALNGKMDIVFASSFLHIWPWDEMILVARRLVKLAKPCKGSIICGKSLASRVAGHYQMPNVYGRNYRHDEASMKRFWAQVGQETGTAWLVETEFYAGDIELAQNRDHWWAEPNQGMIWFCVTRM